MQPSTQQQQPLGLQATDVRTVSTSKAAASLGVSGDCSLADLVKQQLSEVDLTDAACMLILAASAAAAATPAERARAGPFPWPYYFIGTRDSFTHELVPVQSQVNGNRHSLQKAYVTGAPYSCYAMPCHAMPCRAMLCWIERIT